MDNHSVGLDEPLDIAIAPMPSGLTLPLAVLGRLQTRARAEHLATASGEPDLGALVDRAILEEGEGHLTVGAAARLMDDPSDRDLGLLVRELMRGILVRDGYSAAAAALKLEA